MLARSFRGAYLIFAARAFGGEVFGLFLLSWNAIDVLSKIGLFGLDRTRHDRDLFVDGEARARTPGAVTLS